MTTTMFIMYLNAHANDERVTAMPAWVCSPEYVNICLCDVLSRFLWLWDYVFVQQTI